MSKFLFAFVIFIYLIPGCIAVMVHTGTIKSNDGAVSVMPFDADLTADLIFPKISVPDSVSYEFMLNRIPVD